MIMRRYLSMCALAALCAVSCAKQKSDNKILPEFEPFKVVVDSDECSVAICYQRIANSDTNPIFADIEAQNYANTFDEYVVEPMNVETSAQLLIEEYTEEGRWNISNDTPPCFYTMDQQAHFVRDNTILCYETYIEVYTGGAHGGSSMWHECFDLATGQLYDFGYLYDGEWGIAIRELIFDRLKEVEPYTFVADGEMLPMADSVVITNEGLTFVYQPYTVASYSSGIIAIALADKEIASTGAPLVWIAEE